VSAANDASRSYQQIQFLRSLQRLLDDGDFSSTYKYALLLALADLSVEATSTYDQSLSISTNDIAIKFIEYYWRQARPFGGRLIQDRVLFQNAGKHAAVVSELRVLQSEHSTTLPALRRDLSQWDALVGNVRRTVCKMPLWKLQNLGQDVRDEFLYMHPEREGVVGSIELQPGVAGCFREFHGLITNMIRGAWVRKVQSIEANRALLGEDSQLQTFLFGSERADLSALVPILHAHQEGRCFYCDKKTTSNPQVDHFVPWSKYPNDLGNNFVLAHTGCNNSKRDYLAHTDHLAHWHEVNIAQAEGLTSAFGDSNVYYDAAASLQITRWAYECGEHANALMWRYGQQLQYFEPSWRDSFL